VRPERHIPPQAVDKVWENDDVMPIDDSVAMWRGTALGVGLEGPNRYIVPT
jgi:hypothetical protein